MLPPDEVGDNDCGVLVLVGWGRFVGGIAVGGRVGEVVATVGGTAVASGVAVTTTVSMTVVVVEHPINNNTNGSTHRLCPVYFPSFIALIGPLSASLIYLALIPKYQCTPKLQQESVRESSVQK